MPSTLRFITAAAAIIPLVTYPTSSGAQQHAAEISTSVTVRIRPTVTIRDVVPGTARVEAAGKLASTAVVNVLSNLPYRLAVRLAAPISDTRVRVLVRNQSGAFEPLAPGESITTAASRWGAETSHEVACRLEASSPELLDGARCDLVYELSGDYRGTTFTATATR